jgi:hypothetical protein
MKQFLRGAQQQRQLGVGMRGADVFYPDHLAAILGHNLNRDRAGGRPDPPHEPR